MPPIAIILWSVVRYLIAFALTWGVSKGIFSQQNADSALPTLVNAVILALTFIGLVGWSYFQKWYNGWKTQNQKLAEVFEIPFRSFQGNSLPQPSAPPKPLQDKIDQ